MHSAEHGLGHHGAYEREEHVPLGIPLITLGAEERLRPLAADEGGPPLDELVEGREGEADRRHDDEEPASTDERRGAQQDLAGEDRRNETLDEMAKTIVVVAVEVERITNPVADRYVGIGEVAADHQQDAVERQQPIDEHRQARPAVSGDEDRRSHQHRCHFEPPRRSIVRTDSGPDEDGRGDRQEDLPDVTPAGRSCSVHVTDSES